MEVENPAWSSALAGRGRPAGGESRASGLRGVKSPGAAGYHCYQTRTVSALPGTQHPSCHLKYPTYRLGSSIYFTEDIYMSTIYISQ